MIDPGGPFHIHFSDIAYANRNETKHLPYGEGTLRAEPLAEALARFDRPATVISEAPDEASTQAIGAVLRGRQELGEPLLVGRGLGLAAALAQEAGERLERLDAIAPVVRAVEDLERLAQQRLGLLVPALRGAHEPERDPRRRARVHVARPDRLARLEREPLGLVDLALLEEHLRERALALDERAAVLERLQHPDRLAQELLGRRRGRRCASGRSRAS